MNRHILTILIFKGLIVTEPEEPLEPPPLVRMQAPKAPLEEAVAQQDADDEREWEMLELREKTKHLKGLFANRAYVDPAGRHLRISFGEKVGDEDVWHSGSLNGKRETGNG